MRVVQDCHQLVYHNTMHCVEHVVTLRQYVVGAVSQSEGNTFTSRSEPASNRDKLYRVISSLC